MATSAVPQQHRPNVNPTPRARFQESADNISKHRALIESREAQRAFDFAQLEYAAYLAQMVTDNPQSAAFAGLKLSGMMEFASVFKNLGEQPVRIVPARSENLDHSAK